MESRENLVRKLIDLNKGVWQALDSLARDREVSLQQLADEAFRVLLKKHSRPLSLREALKASSRTIAANDPVAKPNPPKRRSKP
jgi:hypothetical protein